MNKTIWISRWFYFTILEEQHTTIAWELENFKSYSDHFILRSLDGLGGQDSDFIKAYTKLLNAMKGKRLI